MLDSWLTKALLPLLSVATGVAAGGLDSYDAQAQAIVDGFSTAQILGQMTQLDLSTVMNGSTRTINETALRSYAKLGVGSYFNTNWGDKPVMGRYSYNASEFRAIVQRIQEVSMEENGGHPIIYALDSIHGASYVSSAVQLPHQINQGASFNPDLAYEVGRITARDSEAAGASWIFSPILDISQNSMWARTLETYGEDPHLTSIMGASYIRGLQTLPRYSKTPTGHDRDAVNMPDFDLLNYFMPPYKAAFEAGALSVMENYVSLNGDPVVSSSKILKDLIRTDLGFDGVLVTDWMEIYNMYEFHRVAATRQEAVSTSLQHTSIDMSMVPSDADFIEYADNMLQEHPEQEARLRESVKRIIKLKLHLGLYDNPVPGQQYVDMVGNKKDEEMALELARESIVLLKNDKNVLPLPKRALVFLTGHSADNVGLQCGGWTWTWQGHSGNDMFKQHGISVRKGMQNLVGNNSFTYFNGLLVNGSISDANLTKAVELAGQHEYTVVALGEVNYAEKPGDIDDLALPEGQVKYVEALAATGTKVIVILFEGRPRLLGSIPDNAVAIIDGMLPCELGGQAMAEILYGDVNPRRRHIAIPYNHRVTTRCMWDNCWMQWDFGAGLSYTQFNYSSVTLDKTTIANADDTLTATVTVTNTGSRAGKETVMLFLIQPFRKISVPEMKMLKKFKKIELQAGESTDVSFALSAEDWGVYEPQFGKGLKRIVEDSKYVVAVKPDTWCNVYGENITNPLCAEFTIDTTSGAGTVNVGVVL
eukprot:jgi/Phyca11/6633/fgenesh1_pm.PHYCAscaffold_13_\